MVNVGVGVVSKGFGDLVRVDRCQCQLNYLTADAWVSGPDLAPQKIYCPKSLGNSCAWGA